MDGFIGEIRAFPYTFAPMGWLECDGTTYPIAPYQALYAVIGNLYGGTLNQNFKVPDLRGRAAVGTGTGANPSLPNVQLAATYGSATNTLTQSTLPNHTHAITTDIVAPPVAANYKSEPARGVSWPSRFYGDITQASPIVGKAFNPTVAGSTPPPTPVQPINPVAMAPQSLAVAGAPTPGTLENRQPYLPLRFCICLEGEFPVRP